MSKPPYVEPVSYICTPEYDSEAQLDAVLAYMSNYDRETHSAGRISAYSFTRMTGGRVPYNFGQTRIRVVLDSAQKRNINGRWSARFCTIKVNNSIGESTSSFEDICSV